MNVWVDLRGDAGGQGRDGRAPWFGPYLRRRLALRFPENDFTSFLVADEEDMKTFFWKVFASFPATKISPAFSSRNFQRMAPGTIHSSTSTTKNPEGRSIERISRRWEIYCGIQRKKKLLKICLGVVDDELRIRLEKRKKKNRYFCLDFTHDIFFRVQIACCASIGGAIDQPSTSSSTPLPEHEAAKTSAKPAH